MHESNCVEHWIIWKVYLNRNTIFFQQFLQEKKNLLFTHFLLRYDFSSFYPLSSNLICDDFSLILNSFSPSLSTKIIDIDLTIFSFKKWYEREFFFFSNHLIDAWNWIEDIYNKIFTIFHFYLTMIRFLMPFLIIVKRRISFFGWANFLFYKFFFNFYLHNFYHHQFNKLFSTWLNLTSFFSFII